MQTPRPRYPSVIVSLLTLLIAGESAAVCRLPKWTKSRKADRQGQALTLVCHGEGVGNDLARLDAIRDCDSRVTTELHQEVHVKDLAVTGDLGSASHVEVVTETCLRGLECLKAEEATCDEGGITNVWRKCTFDMTHVHEGKGGECGAAMPDAVRNQNDVIRNRSQLSTVDKKATVRGVELQRAPGYVLTLTVTPSCDDVLVEGPRARKVPCNANPMSLPIKEGDRSVIVRAKGYLPKTIELGENNKETHAEVYLNAAD